MLKLGATLTERILAFPTPVLTACGGHAIAAGSFLLLAADVRIGVDGPFRIGLNEVKIGLTVPWFAIELARQRLTPAAFSRAVVTAAIHSPVEAVSAGFLDRVLAPGELRAASLQEAEELVGLNAAAHSATKLRARADALAAIRLAIESELSVEGLGAAAPPA
jgi:enoyl-CoA hydratase